MICRVEDCNNSACTESRGSCGYCNLHYQRMRRYGNPLGGRTMRGAPLEFLNRALNYNGDECLLWPFSKTNQGYGQIRLGGKLVLASRYVCGEVNGPAPNKTDHAAHECGNGHLGCITPKHLRWKTHTQNQRDKEKHGTLPKGEGHFQSKLTEKDVRDILELRGVKSQREIAMRFGVFQTTVSSILTGRTWKWLNKAGD